MPGISIIVDDAAVRALLNDIIKKTEDLSPAMRVVAGFMRESVRQNFAAGGRPEKWLPLKTREGQPLRDTNRLMNSITASHDATSATAGTNVVYAAVHQFGAKRGQFGTVTAHVPAHKRRIAMAFGRPLKSPVEVMVRAHTRQQAVPWGNIPARPFMLLQDDDLVDIRQTIADWISGGGGNGR